MPNTVDEFEMRTVEDNKILTKYIRLGTRAYVEYCLRQEYEVIFRFFSCKSYTDGHRTRFRLFLGPHIFNHPYPVENIPEVNPDFVLRYAMTSSEVLEMDGKLTVDFSCNCIF